MNHGEVIVGENDFFLLLYPGAKNRRAWLCAETDAIQREREELERQAGIDTKTYREGERSYRYRSRIRTLYFDIAHEDIRRQLIILERKESATYRQFWELVIKDGERAFAEATDSEGNPSLWVKVAILAALLVAAGNSAMGLPGAIGGAVAGLFVGQGIISYVKVASRHRMEEIRWDLDEIRAEEGNSDYDILNEGEEITGGKSSLITLSGLGIDRPAGECLGGLRVTGLATLPLLPVLRLEFTEPRELLSSPVCPIGKPASVRTIHLCFATAKHLLASLAWSASRGRRITGNRHRSPRICCNGKPSGTSRFRCQRLHGPHPSKSEAI